MGKKLTALFDFQRFAQNQKLAELIAQQETEASLSDDDLGLVNAAGDSASWHNRENKEDHGGELL